MLCNFFTVELAYYVCTLILSLASTFGWPKHSVEIRLVTIIRKRLPIILKDTAYYSNNRPKSYTYYMCILDYSQLLLRGMMGNVTNDHTITFKIGGFEGVFFSSTSLKVGDIEGDPRH